MIKKALFIVSLLSLILILPSCTGATSSNGTDTTTSETETQTTTQQSENEAPTCDEHSFGEWSISKKATCTADGTQKRVCSVCSYEEKQTVAKLGHTEVDIEAIDATCTAEGKTAGKRCTVCTRITKIPTVVAKLPHSITDGICTVCGTEEQSEGLVYELSEDGTYYILTGYGSCTDTDVIIPSTYNGLPVKEIGEKFASYKIQTVTIPESITKVSSEAFGTRQNLKFNTYGGASYLGNKDNPYLVLMSINDKSVSSLEIHESTRVIVDHAFEKCKSLTEITIPESVKSLGYAAFSDCTALTKVIILGKLERIEGYAFYGCTSLSSVTMPDSIKVIDGYAFSYCSVLNGVTLPEELTEISSNAFYGCASLESIVIPDKVTKIWGGAFSGCHALTSVVIGDSLESLDTSVFERCTSLESITLGSSFRTLEHLYNECFDFFRIGVLSEITVDKNNPHLSSKDGVLYNADKTVILCYPGHKSGKSFTLPSTVTEIGESCFHSCAELETVNLSKSLKIISTYGFLGCTSLKSVVFPEGLEELGYCAFSDCSALTNVSLPDSLRVIWSNSFANCGITYLNEGHCTYLGNSKNPYLALMSVNDYASDDHIITVNKNTKIMASQAAKNCYSLKSIFLPEGLTTIGDSAFSLCQSLESITIPSSVTYIGHSAFSQCGKLTEIILPAGITFIGSSAFEYCEGITSIVIPDSVTSIGESAFSQCRALTEVTLSENLESIAAYAFHNCKALKAITIPSSVTYIDEDAFSMCDGIKITYE